MARLADIEHAFLEADKAGDYETAGFLAAIIKDERKRRDSGGDLSGDNVPWTSGVGEDDTPIIDKALDVAQGAVEVPWTMATGLAGQGVGLGNMIHEGVKAYFRGEAEGTGGWKAVDEYMTANGGRAQKKPSG